VREELDGDSVRAELIALGLAGTSPPELSAGLDETYELRVGSECFHVTAADGSVAVRSGPAPFAADLLVECDTDTFLALVTGELTPSQATRQGRARAHGEQTRLTLTRAFRILSYRHAATDFRLVPA
jgi:putative sterol carrier protein